MISNIGTISATSEISGEQPSILFEPPKGYMKGLSRAFIRRITSMEAFNMVIYGNRYFGTFFDG